MRVLLLAGLCLALAVSGCQAKCKAHHTGWKVAGQGPLVSQPVSRNPDKVKVSWAGLLTNQRCVDWYTVSYWRTALDNPNNPLEVKSVNVTSAQNTSLVVIVQPCNEYSFQVEFSQQSFWRSKIHKYKSGVTKFKTQGIPTIKPTFDWQYDLDMYYKMEDGVHNLQRPVVSFRKSDLLVNADCISEVVVRQVPDGSSHGHTSTLEDVYLEAQKEFVEKYGQTESHDHMSPQHEHHYGDEGHFDPSQGIYRHRVRTIFTDLQPKNSRCPVVKCPKCRSRREANYGQTGQTFNGQGYNSQTGQSWDRRGQTGETFNRNRQQGYGGTFVDTSNAHKRRSHGGQQYQQRAPRSIGQQRQPIVDPKTSTVPPFPTDMVEIVLDTSNRTDTCRHGLAFDLEVNADNGRNLYRVRKVHFPLVHQVTRFVPPTMSMVLYEVLHGQGKKIPDSCLPLYMMAIDAQVRSTHTEVEFYQGQYEKLEDRAHKHLEHSHKEKTAVKPAGGKVVPSTRTASATEHDHDHETDHLLSDRDHHRKKTMLKRMGCLCHWTEFVKVNVSDADANYYYPNTTGAYEFSGRTYDGKPYYTYNTTSGGAEVTYYLYYYQPQTTWYIDDNLGDSSPKLSVVGSYERCPGDMSILRMAPPAWQYVKSLRWYNINHMSVSCGVL